MLVIDVSGDEHRFLPTIQTCRKWTAAHPDPPHWYSLEAFERLVGACVHKDRGIRVDRPLGEFLSRFAGLKRSSARKGVTDAAGLTRCGLSCLVNGDGLDRDRTRALLAAMQANSKPPKPEKLGIIGRKHIEHSLRQQRIEDEVTYRVTRGTTEDGMPYVVEAAFARLEDTDSDRTLVSGCNFTPSLFPVTRFLDSMLVEQRAGNSHPVAIIVHIATPNPNHTDRGKSTIEVSGQLGDDLEKCVRGVTAEWCREQKRKERERNWTPPRRVSKEKTTIKDGIFAVMLDSIKAASAGGTCKFDARDMYYQSRRLIQVYTQAELTQKYFEKVVDVWKKAHGLIAGRRRDPRGYLAEPHTGRIIPLGTEAVEDYTIPFHLYHTILYFEKKGMEAKCAWGKIPERYDCAIMASEGFAVRAAKTLLQAAQQGHKMKVLCFHDADPAGYNIFETLSQSSGAHTFSIEVIDAGLHLEECWKWAYRPRNSLA